MFNIKIFIIVLGLVCGSSYGGLYSSLNKSLAYRYVSDPACIRNYYAGGSFVMATNKANLLNLPRRINSVVNKPNIASGGVRFISKQELKKELKTITSEGIENHKNLDADIERERDSNKEVIEPANIEHGNTNNTISSSIKNALGKIGIHDSGYYNGGAYRNQASRYYAGGSLQIRSPSHRAHLIKLPELSELNAHHGSFELLGNGIPSISIGDFVNALRSLIRGHVNYTCMWAMQGIEKFKNKVL